MTDTIPGTEGIASGKMTDTIPQTEGIASGIITENQYV
jgi:hypothetical protein